MIQKICQLYKPWGKGIFLSPETRQVVVGQKGLQPIDWDALQVPKTAQSANLALCSLWKKIEHEFVVYGQITATILVDRHHLYVHTISKLIPEEGDSKLFQGSKPCPDGGKTETFFHGVLFVNGKNVDTANIEAAYNKFGTLTISIPLLV